MAVQTVRSGGRKKVVEHEMVVEIFDLERLLLACVYWTPAPSRLLIGCDTRRRFGAELCCPRMQRCWRSRSW
jgi:hypothetical protein